MSCHRFPIRCFSICALFLAAPFLHAADEAAEGADSIPGTLSLNSRLRYETAEQPGKGDAENLSLRIRPGYTTENYSGFQAMAEGEFTWVADKDDYNAAGVHGDPDKAAIGDPESAQLDQLWLSHTHEDAMLRVGRQEINYDGQRWVGAVPWRQNRQTFDSAYLNWTCPKDIIHLQYAYVDNVVRIFGADAPGSGGNASEFDSNSHLANASFDFAEWGKLVGYGYFLDLDDAPGKVSGSDTFGLSHTATCPDERFPVGTYLEVAQQSDAADNPNDYTATYIHAQANASVKGFMAEAGWELLGGDRTGVDDEGNPTYASVQAPLSTAHKFNGFADLFLVTPDRGLEDAYVMLGYKADLGAAGPLIAKVWYHDFESDIGGDDLGDEIDAVLVKPIPLEGLAGTLQLLAKYADYNGPDGGDDTERFSVEMNYGIQF